MFGSIVLTVTLVVGVAKADYASAQKAYASGDFVQAFEEWKRLADQGQADSQRLVGNMFLNGTGVEADIDQAIAYYQMAADQDDVEALITLANLFRQGGPVQTNYKQAVDMLYRAAETGHPVAQFDLAEIYFYGEGGVQPAQDHALQWYRLSARSGVLLAQFKLGQMLLEGVGGPKDKLTGMMWLELATQTIASDIRLPVSDRVFSPETAVETDEDKRTLGQIIQETRAAYAEKLPQQIVLQAKQLALNYDPARN